MIGSILQSASLKKLSTLLSVCFHMTCQNSNTLKNVLEDNKFQKFHNVPISIFEIRFLDSCMSTKFLFLAEKYPVQQNLKTLKNGISRDISSVH